MSEENPPAVPTKTDSADSDSSPVVSEKDKELEEILARARQVIKPIISREAANEIVSDDLLNFRMKALMPQE